MRTTNFFVLLVDPLTLTNNNGDINNVKADINGIFIEYDKKKLFIVKTNINNSQ